MSSDKMVEPPRPELSPAARALVQARLKGRVRSSGIVPRARRDTAPLSFAQERLWFLDRLEPGSANYNMPWPLRLRGTPDTGALERALGEIVRRHESLRTVFREVDGSPVQVVVPFGGFTLAADDLSGLAEAEREAEVRRRVADEAARPFDLAAGPLFRASLLRLGEDDHLLLLSMHHIVSDEWSMGVLSRELSALYEAYREGRESPLPELAVQYADYAAWQREQLEGEALGQQLAYWRKRLAGAPALLELPTDHPRPAVQTFRGASERVQLPAEVLERLRALARREGATLYMVALSAFQALLSRYSGSEDVVVGSPIAGRGRSEVEGLIGFFVDTLVLRTDVSGDPSFRELLGRVREVTLGAYENQEVPFEKLVAELQPERSLSHAPLFQVSFTLQDTRDSASSGLAELSTERVDAGVAVAKFDLSLTAAATERGLRCGLSYATDLFERGTIVRLLGHLERVLEQVAADADVRISEMDLLSAEERGLVLEEWNRTEAEVPADRCIHELFEAQAARTPDAAALVFGNETLGYAALNERANRLAHHLAGLGVGPETRVGICLERGMEMIVSALAVLKAGGAYVPLDPAYPAERLAFVLADAAVPVLVTQESLRAALPAGDGVAVVSVDGDGERIAAESVEDLDRGVSPDHLAYVIYTSGSTGRPKGVLVPHRGVPNLAYAQARRFGIDGTSRVLQFASFSFDAAVAEVFDALLAGATLVMASREELLPGAGLLETLRRGRVTVATLPPSVLAILPPDDLPELRTVVSAGEAVDAATVERWSAGRTFVNAYGPTETTVCAASARCEADGRAPAIGRPLENVRAYVLDAAGRPAPVGVPGELHVGGVGVARGYLGRPGLTAERFVPDPFGGETGVRLYRTGDRVRWLDGGTLEFLGRVDQQVKVRGFRIEPGEIEGALRRSGGVADCVVVAREDVPGEKRLVAYVVGAVEAGALREHLLRELPEYMVPSAFVFLDALPLTPNGKLDRKALPAPEGDAYARRSYEAPLGEVEAALAEVWAEVLGLERVGRWDHFFELGGHSLLAIRLIERMRRAGLHTDVRALFTTPVLAELALGVGGASSEVEVPANGIPEGCESLTPEMLPLVELSQAEIDRIVAGVPGGAANVQDIYPLAPLQEGFLFHHLLSEEGDPYLTPSVSEFDTRAGLERYLAALQAVIDRHDVLRTSMAWEGVREPVQVVWRHARLPVEEVELDAEAGDAAGQLWRRYDPRHYRMDLGRAPLRRACIAEDRARGRWLLLILMHHLTGDHESLEVQQEEITAHLLGLESELPAPLPFRSYVAQARLGVSREEHERFFRGMLGDVDEPTAPYGLLDVWGEGHGIGEARLAVAGDLAARMRRRARALGVSAASLFHLAWAQVLARVSGRSDVVFGTLLFGRMQGGEGADRVMGPLINTLPVRIGVGEEAVETAVRRTHALLADLLRHEHASLSLAQRSSGVAAPAPLFTSLLNYRHGGGTRRSQAGQPSEGVRGIRAQERTNYPVTLSVDDRGEAFSLTAQVAAPAEAERVCRMMHTALAGLVEALELSPGREIGSIDVLPEAERRIVVEEWNRTEAEVPADRCIHQVFEAQAARTPGAAAVRFEEESLTYRELNERANRLAHHLRGHGVGPEVRVGVLMERGVEMVVSLLAVLKAGGAYVPLDPGLPAERLAYMLDDSGVPLVLVQAALRGAVPAREGVGMLAVDALAERLAAEPAENPAGGAGPDSLAYVIYTSGSTGRPKGVMNAHRGVVNRLVWMQAHFRLGADDVVLQKTPFGFDVSVWEFFWPLQQGARLVMARPDGHRDPTYLRDVIEREGVTTLHFVPSMLQPFVEAVEAGRCASLRHVVCSGEALPAALVRRFHDRFAGPVVLTNLYGPTEAAVDVSCWPCPRDGSGDVVPIGRPVWNTTLYVLDAALRPAPVGTPGELYIGGVQVARGYQGRSAMTAERFVPDPFSVRGGARLYRTGDRARWRADGAIEYLGRLDFQVKVRGFRIELGEIEAVLRQHESVADCVVMARAETGETRLVAYIVGEAEAEELRAHVRRSLPEYMVPSSFVSLDALPLTANGKLDRKALPAPELASTEGRYVAPRTPTEEVLAGIWAEVLRLERVGVEESFFDLGGHSLLATRVISRVRDVFAIELPLRALFERPTVAELAVRVEEMRHAELPVLPPVVPVERTSALPLSFAQERLWFLDRLEPGSPVYNIPVARRLGGALDESALERALGEIVRRHEALRTIFAEADGSPVQVVAPFGGFTLPVDDLSGLAEADREAAARRRASEEARRAFDLSAGPLFRAALLRLDAEEHVLLLSMHHTVSDGWSLGVLFRELSALYAAYREGHESPLAELPVQYADYAVWQREQLAGEVLDRQLAYWKERLAGAPELLELPTDHPRPPVQTYRGATAPVDLPLELLERIQRLGRSEGTTLYMTLLGAFQVLLSKYAGIEDIVVGSPIAGRTRGEVEELIGFFVNTLVLRTGLGGDPSFREILRRVREATLGAYAHQEVPFEKLVAELQPERSFSHSPLFQVMFTLQEAGGGGGALPGLNVSGVGAELGSAQFDLALTLAATAQGLRGALNYNTDLFERGTVERMLGHLARVLEQVAADADARLSRLELLGEAERALVLEAWNRTAAEVPADRCIHELFEAQAARTPGAAALRFEEESLTYAELNERANRLAHHLRGHGVGPEVRVGVLMERGVEMVVSLLAVLKAGGAYVPLDPGLPAERLAYMLDDSGVPLVLVQAALRGAVPAREGVGVLAVDALAERLAAEPAENPAGGAGPDSLAYVIYTSGSTGRPKGVMNAHRGVVNRLVWMQAQFGIGADDVVLQKTPFGFDVSVWEFFWPLQQGATLVMARPDGHRDPQYLQEVIERAGVTTLHFVPSMLQSFVEAMEAGRCASLRHVVCSGEALPPALVRRFHDRFAGPVVLTNLYGPTEAAVDVSCWTCPRDEAADVVPIGRPVWNTALYVLDAGLRPVPVGTPGELYIGGVQVARGYQGRSAMTAERFVPDPFAVRGGARLYRTGDRARWRADGAIEYLGRLDFQVKVRGFRIELGEIEGVLRGHESVTDCVVVARADAGEQRLVAYVVGDVEAGVLREHLRRELPEYMVPAAFVPLERLPLTANGKLDRKALPAPEGDAYARRSYEAPLGEVEAALAEIWSELLGVERVGRWDQFFELGGHSLLAIRLIERMRRVGLYMDVRALFTTPVLAELALAVGGASTEMEVPANGIPEGCGSITPEMLPLVELSQSEIDRAVAGVPGGAANVQDIYPLAPLQEGILFHHLLSREGDPYLLSRVTEFDTRARLDRYLAALQAVIDRHDVLRTAVAWEGLREPVQVVWRHARLPVEEVELDAGAEDAAEQLWRRRDPRRYRMDLGRAPLLQACIAEDRARGRWLLLMLTHHLTNDHESVEVLREEVSAHLRGLESELPAPLPFRNYVAQARMGVSREEHERFFRGMLGDVDEPTAPYGLLDVWGEGRGIGEARLAVEGDLGARLRGRARALGVSVASLCHLAWAQVLARLSGRADVVFGTLLFGRMQGGEGADRVMGPFVNTLPVRIGVGEEGVQAAVRRTHALLADLLRHEHASLALAQRSSGVAAPAPLFTSLLNYRHSDGTKHSRAAGQRAGVRGIRAQERTNYPVMLSVDDLGEEFSLSAQVAAPADAERVCRMMHAALAGLVEALELSPGRAIGSIDVLPEAERRVVVEEWNRTDAEYPASSCIHELFEARAARTPGAEALRHAGGSLTYGELEARANRLARHLRRLGVGPDARVGLCLERGPELMVGVLGILKAGGAYVPLDPAYPGERLAYMLEDSAARVLLTQASLAERLPAGGAMVVRLDADAEEIERESGERLGVPVGPGNLAYVIYTSGSTGRPKGVAMPHRPLVNLLAWQEGAGHAPAGAVTLQFTSISFDVSFQEIFSTWCAGGTLVLLSEEIRVDPQGLARLLEAEGIERLFLPFIALQHLADASVELGIAPASLAEVITAGEQLRVTEPIRRWFARMPGCVLVNQYGPSETHVVSARVLEGEPADWPPLPSIGAPVANTQLYVLDERLEPAPIGVPGELLLGGDAVARGYLERPGLTAERFVPDPFGREPGARLYRTGDRARWLPGGEVEYLGRTDEQVKVRGFRIEPGEVEAVLSDHPEVREAVVVVREDAPGDRRLVAYVVAGESAAVTPAELRAHLKGRLPEYMVPSAVVRLESLPLTPSGKVARRALPAPEYAAAEERHVAPRTPAEEVLAGIWAEVLRLERVGVEASFFELGGHSLLATRVVSGVREAFGVELPLRALFEGPTVAEMARAVEEMRRAGLPVLPPVVPTGRTRALPLSFAQERLWFIDRLDPGSAVYNMPMARRLGGALDEAALERALGEIVRRHEALRTTFAEVDGSPVQVIAPFGGFALPVEDLSALGEADREAAVGRRAGEEARRAFDLSAGPLFRASLLRLGQEDHVLQLSMHHIVSDGWSLGVLFRELSALYEAYREGRESPLPELPVQYADYAAWQREQLEGEMLDRQLSYWRERLTGAPELLELPTDRPRPAVQTYRGASAPVELSLELLERLQRLGRSEGATLYMTLLGAFQVLLGRYGGGEDVVVGSPIAGRTRGEVEGLIGFFVNTLVLRTDLSGDPSFREVLRRVREATLGAYEHQEVPFEKLVAELRPERSLSHSPLFQVSFALQNAEGRRGALPGLQVGGVDAALEIAKFDLTLALAATAQGLRGVLDYSADLFERGTVDRMLGHLERVLEQVAADADVRLSRLELLGEAERALVLEAWNRTEAEVPRDVCVHELFEAQVERTPGAVALVYEDEEVAYAELNARANRLARRLGDLGVGPEARVGLCVERGIEMVVAVLAVLKAGGAYVPLDPEYPEERLRHMLQDSAPVVLLTQRSLSGRFDGSGVPIEVLDGGDASVLTGRPDSNPGRGALTPENLAYVIYTSGSTGQPKGVMNGHRGVVNLLAWGERHWELGAGDALLQRTSLSFDVSVRELFQPLLVGARLVLVRPGGQREVDYLVEVVRRQEVSTMVLTPSQMQAFLEHPGLQGCSTLRRIVLGGESIPVGMLAELRARLPGARLYHEYGPTEATVTSTARICGAEGEAPGASIGGPISNARAYLLDARGEPVPVGVAGELLIGGAGVARGYLGRPELTAERFIPDSFGAEPGARLYRTGDLGRWLADGTIEFLGRVDTQVKVRGYRIEPGEIEARLLERDGVSEAVVVAREDGAGNRRLVAYVVGGAEAGALREHLRRELPDYMVPAAFVPLERLPLTPSGKLDRKALPAPELASAEERYVAPRTPTEEVLAEIWAETLRLERVGVRDSFFELGGHSLLATRVVSRVREVFGVELPLRALFEGPTVAEMAGRVEEIRRAGLPVLPPVVPAGRTGPLPLSFAQERLWFIDRLDPGGAVYNIPVAWRLEGALDEAALERSLGEIVRRHESLRTVFAEVDGSPVQVIAPFGGFFLPVEELSGLGDADREAAVVRRAGEEAGRAFDLSRGPLFRATLLRLGGEDHVLLFSMHHIVSDGWSMEVLFRELSSLYAAYSEGRESPLRELAVQYADYAVWQREQLEGEVLDRQLSYWKEQLSGAPELLELPTDRPRPPVRTYGGATVPVNLSPELLERLQALGRSEGATLYMTLLGAFQVLLAKHGGGDDIVVGSPIAGRMRREVEELIGFFVNTLVLRTDLSGDPSFRDTLRRVRQVTLGAYEHQDVPFERLVEELQPERSLSHSPVFQVMFTLQNAGGGGGGGPLPGLKVGGVGAELEGAKFDLSLSLAATPRGLRGGLSYSTDLFEPGTMERMVRHLERLLEQVAADADARLSRLDLLDEAERALVLEEWNRTDAGVPADRCIHQLFEAQAARAPEAVAVRFGGTELTYADLDTRANQLAHYLRALGVGPDARVGVLLERSAELIVALLAVFKAGGAYVPLDPAYPAERLEMMLADSGAAVLLTRETLRALLPPRAGVETVAVDAERAEIAAESAGRPESGATARTLAYVVYTSGSTGTPKGVAVEHGGLASLCAWHARAFAVTPADRATQLASPGFDAAGWEVWPYLAAGACVEVVPDEVRADPEALRDWLVGRSVSIAFVPTPVAEPMLALEWPRETALRWLLAGGDRLRARPAADLPFTLSNNYGPTECTVVATSGVVEADGARTPSIGGPIAHTRAYVLDAGGRPLPVGVPGELHVGGAQVARGYLNRPGLTAERFVPDPFGGEAGARLYRTGDRVRWLDDGTLEFLGRLDEQVKIRGFRIELGEIEARLAGHPEVREAVVLVREDRPGDRRLVAYVVADHPDAMDVAALRAHVRQSLPEYMVPAAIVVLEQLPLTPNGKLDRRALPAPDPASAEESYAAPRTPVEEVLAGIWAEVLRLERVGVEESFFELGGHSLMATRVVSRIRAVFGVELPLRALFEGPTVAELAKAVEEMRRAELPVLPPVVPTERAGALPLSFAQERLWFLDRLDPGSAVYNIPAALRLAGALDERALERALGEIVRRHEVLRTTFAEVDSSPVQVISPFSGFVLPAEELSALSEADRESAVSRRAGEEAARPFDLAAGPLFRAALLRLGAEDHVLLLSMHHIVSDGWSSGVLLRELSALYAAYREGGESPLAELAVQYADYAVWQREQLAGEVLDRQLSYWRERLAGAPELLELPTDRPRPAMQTYRGATAPVELSLELLERIQRLGRSEGTTLYMTLLGAFQVLLGKYAGSEDVVVGSPIAGRTRAEVEELIGFFANTFVLRTDLSGDPSFRETLRRVREATLGAYAHQELPFEKLVAELQPERSLSHSPLFQVMFTLQNAGGGGGAFPGLSVSGVGTERANANFDLSLTLTATAQGLRGGLNYSTDLFERATVERMLGHLERVLEQATADADVRLSRLELIGDSERALVVEEWNRTDAEYPADACIHELIEAQAARTPGAVAVVFEGVSLTYAELDARANRLARHLAGLGAGPEARVGICVDRSAEMVVAMLAVLKSGAAYLPLDPSYPADRLAYMLEDSGAPLLVTQASLRGLLPADGVRIVSVDGDAAAIASNSADAPRTSVDAANSAYVIYTSGSTGRPKGVQVTHGNAVSFFAGMDERVGGSAAGTWLAVTRISFDIHVLELLWTLARGFRMVVQPEPDRALGGESIAEQIRRHAVTHLQCTPSLAAMMIAESGTGALSGLERILLGGEALPPDLAARITAVLPNGLVNMYGPTETTVWSATHAVDVADGPVPIGRPIANTRVYVLDAALRPQPAGVPGELFIGGPGVTRGYLGRPGLTAERFVPDAFSAEPGARLYRTGDRARWREESAEVRECVSAGVDPVPNSCTDALTHSRTAVLEYLGRLDAQVKVRGFRIEPGEIEAVLRRHPAVVECAVVARAAGAGDTRLVAYVVGAAEADALRAHVGRSLPEYMVPGAFVSLEALPLTPNGKLDRKALPAPEGSSYATRAYEAPRTEAERRVAAAWAEVLGVESVGAHDRFFDLGGHSLLLVRAQARLREAFGQPVPITHLFRYLTVSALAAALDAPAPEPDAAPADDARVRDGRHRLRARGRAGVNGGRGDGA